MILGLGGGGEGGVGSAVEAVVHGHNFCATLRMPIGTGQLDGGLVGFGSRVAEEGFTAKTSFGKCLGELALGFHIPGVGHMDQGFDLFGDGLNHARRAVADEVAAPAREEVHISTAFSVPYQRAFASNQTDWIATIIGDHVAIELVDDFRR